MVRVCELGECNGCGCCVNVCPVDAISFTLDQNGFYKSEIDQKSCIECNKCINACPVLNDQEKKNAVQEAFAVISNDKKWIRKSASGGVFSTLAKMFLSRGFIVFAAMMDEKFNVEIKKIHDEKDIAKACGSKYVQSKTGNSYKEVRGALEQNEKVVYFGLPCQVAGLKHFLGKENDGLYTIELVCHGVPSSEYMKKYIQYESEKNHSNVVEYRHRYKVGKCTPIVAITSYLEYENGKRVIKDSADDPYLLSFRMGLSIGEHCTKCHFSELMREADLTMGDFLGIGSVKVYSQDISDGVSMLLVNTDKGRDILNMGKDLFSIEGRDLKECMVFNDNIWTRTKSNPISKEFMRDLQHMNYDDVRKKYLDKSIKNVSSKLIKSTIRNVVGDKVVAKWMKESIYKNGTIEKIDAAYAEFVEKSR